jgi:hypothetical protein
LTLSTISEKLAIFLSKRILFLSSHIFHEVDNQNTRENLRYLKPLKMLLKTVKFRTSLSSQDSGTNSTKRKLCSKLFWQCSKRRTNDYAIRNDINKAHNKFDDCLLEYLYAKSQPNTFILLGTTVCHEQVRGPINLIH